MPVNKRYFFDLNKMEFILPLGEQPQEPFIISLVFNGIDLDEELARQDFTIFILRKLIEQSEDIWELVQLEEAVYKLEIQRNFLLQSVILYLHEFWRDLEGIETFRCPQCGKAYFIKYIIEYTEDRRTNSAG